MRNYNNNSNVAVTTTTATAEKNAEKKNWIEITSFTLPCSSHSALETLNCDSSDFSVLHCRTLLACDISSNIFSSQSFSNEDGSSCWWSLARVVLWCWHYTFDEVNRLICFLALKNFVVCFVFVLWWGSKKMKYSSFKFLTRFWWKEECPLTDYAHTLF